MLESSGKFGVAREMGIKITQKGLEYMSINSEAMLFWENRQSELQAEIGLKSEYAKQGRMEEK